MSVAAAAPANVAALVTSSNALLMVRVEDPAGPRLELPAVPGDERAIVTHVRDRFGGEVYRLRRIVTVGNPGERLTLWGARLLGHAPGRWPVPAGTGSANAAGAHVSVGPQELESAWVEPAAAHRVLAELARTGRVLDVLIGPRAVHR